jgi:hypothetical protein
MAMLDRWYDSMEAQIDRGMDAVGAVLFWLAIAGVILLVIVQGIKAIG